MPDWNALVRERLDAAGAPSVDGADIAELAGHVEDLYEQLRRNGMCESEALGQALRVIRDWRELAERIRRAKGGEETMNHRTKTLWLPGLLGLTASMVWLMILQRASVEPRMPWLHSGLAWKPYLVWLISQPVFGATSAYLSRRAGGERRNEVTASLFPAIVMLGLWCFVIAGAILIERNPYVIRQWPMALAGALVWSVFPGLSLLLGRFVFLKTRSIARS